VSDNAKESLSTQLMSLFNADFSTPIRGEGITKDMPTY
jgi:hypothetical protein